MSAVATMARLGERINALSLRERALVFMTVSVALYVLASNVILQPLADKAVHLERAIKVRASQVTTLEIKVRELGAGGSFDPELDEAGRIEKLNARLRGIDASLASLTAGLVSPKEMAKLAERVLHENRRLELVKMQSIKAVPLLASRRDAGTPAADIEIYRHGIRLELRGRYGDIVDYIQRLEKLPWKFFWAEVSLELEQHPTSRVVLVLYTVSLEKGWIGT